MKAIPKLDLSAALRPHKPVLELRTYEVVLEGLSLGKGFTKRYAAICRNWHIGWLGLDLPLQEVWDEKCDERGKSWTYIVGTDSGPGGLWDRLAEQRKKIKSM
jgi:hypothetical protein